MEKTKEQQPKGAFALFFNNGFGESGYNLKLIAEIAKAENETKLLWQKWQSFKHWFPTSEITFQEADEYLQTFQYLVKRLYKEPNKPITEMKEEYTSKRKTFFINRWKHFLTLLNETEPQECKRTRFAFQEKVYDVFKDDPDAYEGTISKMVKEYEEAYRRTGRLYSITNEDLDPDLKYSNLNEESFDLAALLEPDPTEETESKPFKWFKVWKRLKESGTTINEHTAQALLKKAKEDGLSEWYVERLEETIKKELKTVKRINTKYDDLPY